MKVGDRVVCVDDSDPGYPDVPMPVKGNIYTIRGLSDSSLLNVPEDRRYGFLLDEVRSGRCTVNGRETGYARWRFRPLVSQFDFRALVTPAALDKFQREEERQKEKV